MKLRPLQKATFSIQPSEELVDEGGTQSYEHVDGCNPEWCQGRADQHEEPFPDELKIVSKLMTLYQPGGTQEKMVVLRQLEDPGEQPNPGAAAGALRKWIRWLRRAEDISLSLPDPTILMRWCGTLCSWTPCPTARRSARSASTCVGPHGEEGQAGDCGASLWAAATIEADTDTNWRSYV